MVLVSLFLLWMSVWTELLVVVFGVVLKAGEGIGGVGRVVVVKCEIFL